MFEELGELLLGPWGIAVAIAGAAFGTEAGRKTLKSAAKAVIKVGHQVVEAGSSAVDSVKSEIEELKKEIEEEDKPAGKKRRAKASAE